MDVFQDEIIIQFKQINPVESCSTIILFIFWFQVKG